MSLGFGLTFVAVFLFSTPDMIAIVIIVTVYSIVVIVVIVCLSLDVVVFVFVFCSVIIVLNHYPVVIQPISPINWFYNVISCYAMNNVYVCVKYSISVYM